MLVSYYLGSSNIIAISVSSVLAVVLIITCVMMLVIIIVAVSSKRKKKDLNISSLLAIGFDNGSKSSYVYVSRVRSIRIRCMHEYIQQLLLLFS